MKTSFTFLNVIILVILSSTMNSQGVDWLKKYDGVNIYNNDIAPGNNGELYACVNTQSGTSTYDTYTLNCTGSNNFSISRIDASGSVSLIKNFTSPNVSGTRITVDASGNIFCAGTYSGTLVFDTYTITGGVSFLLKMNSSGAVQWVQDIGNNGTTSIILQSPLRTDGSGNIYYGGSFNGTLTVGSFSASTFLSSDGFLLKFDGNGNVQWLQSIGSSKKVYIADINIDVSGNIYAVGNFSQTCVAGSYSLTAYGDYDGFICKLNNSGNILWLKQYGYWNKDYFQSISLTNTGKMYLTGGYNYTTVIGTNTLTNNFGTPNFLAKMDTAGTVLWAKQFAATTGTYGAFITNATTDGSDVVYIAGIVQGTLVCFGSASVSASCLTSSVANEFVAQLDGNGNFSWVKHLKSSAQFGQALPIVKEKNGKLFVAGDVPYTSFMSVDSYSVMGAFNSYYFLRLNPALIGLEEYQNDDQVKVYPNPVKADDVITFADLTSVNNRIVLSDITGKIIVNTNLVNSKLPLSNYHLVRGIYILKIITNSQNALIKKIVVE